MIIVEGADGTGKTTLCQELAKELKLEYVKIPRHKGDPETNGLKFYMQAAEQLPDNSVVDRFHLGECVYPELYETDSRRPLRLWEQHAIERLLHVRGCILIHCTANTDFITHNLDDRKENYIWNQVNQEKELFAEKVWQSLLLKKTYIADHTNTDNFCHNIELLHNSIAHKQDTFREYLSTGSTYYPLMIVGDRVNDKYGTKYAFNSWTGASAYLHQALDITDNKGHYYLTNAYKSGNLESNISIIMKEKYYVDPVNILALGQRAHQLLDKCGLNHHTIEHPAHHQRFHHDVYDYAFQISQVVA